MCHQFENWLLMGFLLVLMSACAAGGRGSYQPLPPAAPALPSPPLKPGDIVDTQTGKTISFDSLMDELADIDVIYVGETHINMEDHRAQLEILKGLHDRSPSVVLAMEMFPREVQPVLDRYSQWLIDESGLLEESDWKGVWGYPFELYRGLLAYAHDKKLKILALNAPSAVVRKISRDGLASLSPEERGKVAVDFLMDDPRHRDYLRKQYEQHLKESIKDFDTFYEAQLSWEETMAETLGRELAVLGRGDRILVLIGQGHIVNHFGVPQLTSLRAQHLHKTIIPATVDDSVEAINEKSADYIWITKDPEPVHRGRLGVMFRPAATGDGLEVLAVLPGSPAEKAGVKKGDLLYLFDGAPISNIEGLHDALKQDVPLHELGIRRDGDTITIEVTIPK